MARANRHLGYLSKAVENCELALSHLSKIDPSKETELNKEKFYKVRINSRILRSYASVHYDLGDYQKSLERSEQALECSRNMQEDNPLEHEIGDSLAYKALALFSLNKEEKAIEVMLESIAKLEKSKDKLYEGYARCYLIRFYLKRDQLEDANNEIAKVQEIERKDNLLLLKARLCGSKIRFYLKRDQLEDANNEIAKVQEIERKDNLLLLKARLCGSKAQFNRKQFQVTKQIECGDRAIHEHENSINILLGIECKPLLAEEYFQFGLTYQAMGEYDQAEKYKAKSLELFAQMEAQKQIERVNKAFEQGAIK